MKLILEKVTKVKGIDFDDKEIKGFITVSECLYKICDTMRVETGSGLIRIGCDEISISDIITYLDAIVDGTFEPLE